MTMYFENVEDYLEEYGTLTKTIIFSKEGEKLFSVPEETEFSKPHYMAVVRCMADSFHPLAGVIVGDTVYKCLRVDDGLLVGRSDTEGFVAYKSDDIVIVGFSDREKSGDCCLTDVKNVERELYRAPDIEQEDVGDEDGAEDTQRGGGQVQVGEEEVISARDTILQATVPKTHHSGKPKVMFAEGGAPTAPTQRHVNSARMLPRSRLPSEPERDLEAVTEAYETNLAEGDSSFERIELEEVRAEVPQAAPEETGLLRDVP